MYREVLKLLPCYLAAGCTLDVGQRERERERGAGVGGDKGASSGSSFMKGTDARRLPDEGVREREERRGPTGTRCARTVSSSNLSAICYGGYDVGRGDGRAPRWVCWVEGVYDAKHVGRVAVTPALRAPGPPRSRQHARQGPARAQPAARISKGSVFFFLSLRARQGSTELSNGERKGYLVRGSWWLKLVLLRGRPLIYGREDTSREIFVLNTLTRARARITHR